MNSFSDFARMPKPVFEKNDILKILINAQETYKLNYEKIKFVLKNLLNENEIYCDKGQINRVLLNIYKNAIESIDEKSMNSSFNGEIITKLSNDNKFYFITIYDNGVGFKDSGNSKHNDPYFSTKKDGSGLGLSIVSKIIHEHNGQIFYDNRSDINGAYVTISLPKKNMKKILIVDDEKDIRFILEEILSEKYSVVAIGTIKEAEEYINKNTFDLALLDVLLDEKSRDGLYLLN